MSKYPFEHLQAHQFENLVNALLNEYVAPVSRELNYGFDIGWDMSYEGEMSYPATQHWNGFLVVQCKQQRRDERSAVRSIQWGLSMLENDLKRFKSTRARIPDYYLFVTDTQLNEPNSQKVNSRVTLYLDRFVKELGIKDAAVWDYNILNKLLGDYPEIAQRFGLISNSNFSDVVMPTVRTHRAKIEAILLDFLEAELRTDQYVNLAQAGHTNDGRTPLARVFVDLRATSRGGPANGFLVVDAIQHASDRTLLVRDLEREAYETREKQRPTGPIVDGAAEDIDEAVNDEIEYSTRIARVNRVDAPKRVTWSNPSRFVIIGGPGQGKSTIAQHLAQRHRSALLNQVDFFDLKSGTLEIIHVVEKSAEASGTGLPQHPRYPFRVVLEQFADALATGEVKSVIDYIASLVRRRTSHEFTLGDAYYMLSRTPLFVAFDGLDEVPAVSNRAEVLEAVRHFLVQAQVEDADLLVIATTRPQGYGDDFAHDKFNHVILKALSPSESLAYAQKFVEAKYGTEIERRERIMQRLEAAAREESIVRLMQTPLQVTIMAALVDLVGNPPRERYLLFQRYYEIVYQREQERGLTLSDVLAHYRAGIEILHDRIGLLLQLEAESKGKTESRLSRERLEKIVHDYLVAEEFSGEALERTKANFMDVALLRLVFIVPLQDGLYGFEVRSLQEFSAARALMRGSYSTVKERLRAIAPVPYWRNTTLFAIGRAFAEQDEPQCDMIVSLCTELNEAKDLILSRTLAGARLALDILEDGMVAWRPGYRRQFVEAALQLLRLPHKATSVRLANCYSYTSSDEQRYERAIHATAATIGTSLPIGLFITLASLAEREDGSIWAQELLMRYWPTQIADETAIVEQIFTMLPPSEWASAMMTRVAGANDLDWLISHPGGREAPAWTKDIRWLRRERRYEIYLAGEPQIFAYRMQFAHIRQEVIDQLRAARPTHPELIPYVVGGAFMVNPTPETLADALEAMVQTGSWQPGTDYDILPWQLATILTFSESNAELLQHAQRARQGELGTAQDWLAAEERWTTQPFTIEDLTVLSHTEWPFTSKIATVGMLPTGYIKMSGEIDNVNEAAISLLQAFSTMSSTRYRSYVAMAFFFVTANNEGPRLTLPISVISTLAAATIYQVQVSGLLRLLDPGLVWADEVRTLDFIGSRISVLSYNDDKPNLEEEELDRVVVQLVSLLNTGKSSTREGLLRFAAALAVAQVYIPVPAINPVHLSSDGRIALIALNLLASNSVIDSHSLAQEVVQLWLHQRAHTYIREMPRVINRVLERQPLPAHVVEVLDILYKSEVVEAHVKLKIIDSLLLQVQYRTSGLGRPEQTKKLATGWLIEALASA